MKNESLSLTYERLREKLGDVYQHFSHNFSFHENISQPAEKIRPKVTLVLFAFQQPNVSSHFKCGKEFFKSDSKNWRVSSQSWLNAKKSTRRQVRRILSFSMIFERVVQLIAFILFPLAYLMNILHYSQRKYNWKIIVYNWYWISYN